MEVFMAGLTFIWTLRGQGWASCTIADDQAQAKAIASDITNGPEQLLLAITALPLTDSPTRAEFEAEPTVFRWFFQRDGSNVDIRLVRADDTSRPDSEGTVIWSGHQTVDALARAVISGFDQVARELGEDNYLAQWGRDFPRTELETLRSTWHQSTGNMTPDTDS